MSYRDFNAELEQLERRRQISEALLAQSMGPAGGTEFVGPANVAQAVRKSPFEHLSRGLMPMVNAYGMRKIEDQQNALRGEHSDAVTKALEEYQQAVTGGADPRTAATGLMGSFVDPSKVAEFIAADAFRPRKYLSPIESESGEFIQPSAEGGAPLPLGIKAPPPDVKTAMTGDPTDPNLRQTVTFNPRDPSQFNPLGAPYKARPAAEVNMGNLLPPEEKEYDRTMGRSLSEEFITLQKGEQAALDRVAKLSEIDRLLADVYTGIGGNQVLSAQKLAQALGLPVDPASIGSKEAAMAIGREAALQLRNPAGGAGMPGAMSDQDRNFLESMNPNLAMTAQGRKMLVETQRRIAKRSAEVAKLARSYAASHNGRLDSGFYQALHDTFGSTSLFTGDPMFEELRPPTPEEIEAEIARRLGGQ